MNDHAQYTHEAFVAGKILVYGPVMAREGAFGMAVLEVEDEAEARKIAESDPTVRAGMFAFEVSPMRIPEA